MKGIPAYSLLVKVAGCVQTVCWNNLRTCLMNFVVSWFGYPDLFASFSWCKPSNRSFEANFKTYSILAQTLSYRCSIFFIMEDRFPCDVFGQMIATNPPRSTFQTVVLVRQSPQIGTWFRFMNYLMVSMFFIFIPIWGNDPIWRIFFRSVETTSQLW